MNSFQPQQQMPMQQQAPADMSPDEIAGGHRALNATIDGLIKLVSKPPGELTKKCVFDEASTMIAHGAFATPEAKQQLIGELANLPDDENDIRKLLGKQLLTLAHVHNKYKAKFGEAQ